MNLGDPGERSASAGEYVLGTLGAAERAEFEAALATDAALLAEVYAWQDRLLALAGRAAPVQPPASGWAGIEARLPPPAAAAATPVPASAPAARVVPPAPAANDPQWQRVRRWQFASAFAVAACLVLATLLVLRGPATPLAAERFLAVLQSPADRSTGWIVEATAGGEVRLIPVGASPELPPGKTLQFWTKAEGAAGPTSLGLVKAGTPATVPVAKMPTLGERQLFELTLEPENGSPLGRPTGPVLFLGRSVRL